MYRVGSNRAGWTWVNSPEGHPTGDTRDTKNTVKTQISDIVFSGKIVFSIFWVYMEDPIKKPR